jgi:hypothetical protein
MKEARHNVIKQQTYRDHGVQLLLGALLLTLAGSSLSTMYEQRRLEKLIKTCMITRAMKISFGLFFLNIPI